MIEHFGSSLVAVRLIAYLRKRTANQSVAAFEADAEVLSRSAIAAMAELRGNTGWRTVRRCCARIDRMPWAALQHHHWYRSPRSRQRPRIQQDRAGRNAAIGENGASRRPM